ncbi:YcnI family protein, partial [Streptomyces sp. MCAF7]
MFPTHRRTRRAPLRRAALVAALAAAGVLAGAGAASAHVTVHPDSYPQGTTDGSLTFRVPNEEDSATTTKVQVFLPTDHPIPSVLVKPVAGWTTDVKTTKLKKPITTDDGQITNAASEITWTKGKIEPGQYQDFDVAFGQLPEDTDQLVFKTVQTYSDGKVARWIEEPRKGQAEPEDPAPVLHLTKATNAEAKETKTKTTRSATSTKASASDDSTARGLGIA